MRSCIRTLFVALIGLVALDAHAQFYAGAGVEYFRWVEDTQPIKVKEHGPLGVFTLGYTQPRQSGILFAYRGRFYIGEVDYDGAYLFSPSVSAMGKSRYAGTTQEGQLRYRLAGKADIVAALGIDIWQRELSSIQKEDYRVVFARLGAETNPAKLGWLIGAGVKYPLWTQQDAHLMNFGYDTNPKLKPGKNISGYGQVGYRFRQKWAIIGYVDGYRFKASDPVTVTTGGASPVTFGQPAIDTYVIGLKAEYRF